MKEIIFPNIQNWEKLCNIPGNASEGIVTSSMRALMKTVEKIRCHLVFSLNIRVSLRNQLPVPSVEDDLNLA